MDNRTKLINSILASLQADLDPDQLKKVESILYIQLDKYEVTDRCTDVALADNNPDMALKKFIATKRLEGKSENTLKQYVFHCKKMLHSIGKPVDEITLYDLRFYLASYKETRKVSNRTVENARICLKAFFGWMAAEGMIPSNPCDGLSPIKCEKKVRKPFSPDEMERIRRSCKSKRDRALVEFLYASGCRVSEVVSLDRSDIDWQQKQATVTGKGNKQRTIYIDDVSLLYLSEYLESRHDPDPCLFAGQKLENGTRRLSRSGIEALLRRLGKRANVEDVHPHKFRRTLASDMIARGATIQDVAVLLGHENISTTQIYCYVDDASVQSTYHRCIA